MKITLIMMIIRYISCTHVNTHSSTDTQQCVFSLHFHQIHRNGLFYWLLKKWQKQQWLKATEIHFTATAPQHCMLIGLESKLQVSGSSFNITQTTISKLDIYTKSVRPVQMFCKFKTIILSINVTMESKSLYLMC